MRALLDINVLIALLDRDHVHHDAASRWLQKNSKFGWASCPLTQNGCIRIMSNTAYPSRLAIVEIVERLSEAAHDPSHEFWPDDFSLLQSKKVAWQHVLGSRQLTDVYLLGLAAQHKGRFVTLDGGITLASIPGATKANLVCIV